MHTFLDSLCLDRVNIENYLHDRKKMIFTSPARIKSEIESKKSNESPFNLLIVKSPSFI